MDNEKTETEKAFEEMRKVAEEHNKQNPQAVTSGYLQVLPYYQPVCPGCGRCNHCGRGGQFFQPSYVPWWISQPYTNSPNYYTVTVTNTAGGIY